MLNYSESQRYQRVAAGTRSVIEYAIRKFFWASEADKVEIDKMGRVTVNEKNTNLVVLKSPDKYNNLKLTLIDMAA